MEQKKNLGIEDTVFMLLETLKSNGTFDEFRRHCVSDIDAKPTYQNWKQRIESNVIKFLSKVKYTPELNKNTVRERLRKHLLDGRETRDIEEGADRILTQVLAPRTLSIFEPKISDAVNEYLGIKSEAPPIEQNGLKQSNVDLKKVSDVEINTISNPKIDLILDADDIENIDETSPEFEPLTSVLENENSNDESVSGMSDLVSVGSPNQFVSQENHDNNSNGFKTGKNSIEKSLQISSDKNGIINHKNDSSNNISDNVTKISNNTEKLKTNNSKSKSKHHSSRTSRHTSSQEKSSTHRSKDRNSTSSHRSTSQEKNYIKKRNDSRSKDRKNSSSSHHSKHHSDSKDKDKKHKLAKKSHHSSRGRSPKTDRKHSRSDKKEKSSSLCKEPKSLNGNRSDDESNAGGSSKQKSSIYKNKSSTSDKSKSSSSNHKNKKDNGSKDVVDKPKDKSSMSKSSKSSSDKNSQINIKSCKRSFEEKHELSANNLNNERKKAKWSDNNHSSFLRTNDEQDVVKVLLSMSEISYESSHSEIVTENIIFVENSSLSEPLDVPLYTPENTFSNVQENSNQTPQLNDSQDIKENIDLKTNDSRTSGKFDSVDDSISNINQSCINVCSVNTDSECQLSCQNVKLQDSLTDVETSLEPNEQVELLEDEKKCITLSAEVNLNSSVIQTTSKCDTNECLKVPKLKLKLLPNQVDFINNGKRKKHHKNKESKFKKLKSSNSNVTLDNEISIPVIDTVQKTTICKPIKNKSYYDVDSKIIESEIDSPKQMFNEKCDSESIQKLDDTNSVYTFKGFTQADAIPCKNYERLKDLVYRLQEEKNCSNVLIDDNDGFKGFSSKNKTLQKEIDSQNLIDNDDNGFKGFENKDKTLLKEINNQKVIDSEGFKGFSSKNKILQKEINCQKLIDNDDNGFKGFKNKDKTLLKELEKHNEGFKGFTCTEILPCTKRDIVHSQFIKLKENLGFMGFTNEEAQVCNGYKYVKQQLELAKNQNNIDNQQKSIALAGNGIQNGTFNKVITLLYENDKNNESTSNKVYSQSNTDNKSHCSTVNNNNHDITATDSWVAAQEMKYKLLPVKVKLERLLEIRCNDLDNKHVSGSSQVPSLPQRNQK